MPHATKLEPTSMPNTHYKSVQKLISAKERKLMKHHVFPEVVKPTKLCSRVGASTIRCKISFVLFLKVKSCWHLHESTTFRAKQRSRAGASAIAKSSFPRFAWKSCWHLHESVTLRVPKKPVLARNGKRV